MRFFDLLVLDLVFRVDLFLPRSVWSSRQFYFDLYWFGLLSSFILTYIFSFYEFCLCLKNLNLLI